jgi:hypothetical protein
MLSLANLIAPSQVITQGPSFNQVVGPIYYDESRSKRRRRRIYMASGDRWGTQSARQAKRQKITPSSRWSTSATIINEEGSNKRSRHVRPPFNVERGVGSGVKSQAAAPRDFRCVGTRIGPTALPAPPPRVYLSIHRTSAAMSNPLPRASVRRGSSVERTRRRAPRISRGGQA